VTTQLRPAHATRGVVADTRTVARQINYEQRAFWRAPQSAIFTFALPLLLLVVFAGLYKGQTLPTRGGVSALQYFIPAMLAYGLMASCFVNLAIGVASRRELGLLKRVRGTPLAPWQYLASVVGNALVVGGTEVILGLLVARFGYSVHMPDALPFVVSVAVGAATFSLMGLAASTFVPSADSAPAIVNLPFFVLTFLSGVFYPFAHGSWLSKVAGYFPVAHFIDALFAPFDTLRGAKPWAWHDLFVLAIWGAVALFITVRRFTWEPRGG
jgi:ABC-2 type transport system permease protein